MSNEILLQRRLCVVSASAVAREDMSERNARLIAEALIAQLGKSALPHARQRLEELRAEQDVSAQQVWVEILGELIQLTGDDGNGLVH
jgi:hypothetical protein